MNQTERLMAEYQENLNDYEKLDPTSHDLAVERQRTSSQCRSERFGEELRMTLGGNRLTTLPTITPRTTGELDKH